MDAPIVDQGALTRMLRERRIQWAGLDVFEQEPPALDDPLVGLDNVLLGPHALAWTDECFAGNGRGACQSIVDVSGGVVPPYVVNTDVLPSPAFRSALERYGAAVAGGVER